MPGLKLKHVSKARPLLAKVPVDCLVLSPTKKILKPYSNDKGGQIRNNGDIFNLSFWQRLTGIQVAPMQFFVAQGKQGYNLTPLEICADMVTSLTS